MSDPGRQAIDEAERIVRQAVCEHRDAVDITAWADRPNRRKMCCICRATWIEEP